MVLVGYWITSFFLGAVAVLQGGLNRQFARDFGLSTAILVNSVVLLAVAFLFAGLCLLYPQSIPETFVARLSSFQWRWWYLIPGICGFGLVAGIPALIPKLGALNVFLCIVVGQMIFSLIWDYQMEQLSLDPRRIAGVVLAVSGLLVAYWKNPLS